MIRAIVLLPLLLLAFLVSGCGHGVSFGSASTQSAPAGMNLTDLHNLGDLQTRFNEDAGKPRLILLVSPT